MATLKRKTKRLRKGGRTRRHRGGQNTLGRAAVKTVARRAAAGAAKGLANQVSPHYENIADRLFNSPSAKKGFANASGLLSAYSQGDLTSTLAAQHGLTEEAINQKAIAASNLVVKMMQDPEVQKAVANVDVAAVGMGANIVNKLEPIVLKTMMKTGKQLSTLL